MLSALLGPKGTPLALMSTVQYFCRLCKFCFGTLRETPRSHCGLLLGAGLGDRSCSIRYIIVF